MKILLKKKVYTSRDICIKSTRKSSQPKKKKKNANADAQKLFPNVT